MLLGKKFDAFVQQSPVSVMLRGILERILHPEPLQKLFDDFAVDQYTRKLTFFQCVQIMSDVVLQTSPSVGAWYQKFGEDLSVSRQAVYDKLALTETAVSAALVNYSAREVMTSLKGLKAAAATPLLRGYRVRVLDGNHLPGTEHRLKDLRQYNAAALPGQALVLYDPQYDVITDVLPCEDAYTQERAFLGDVLELLKEWDCVLADRNFCTAAFLTRIEKRRAFFVIRQHGRMKCRLLGKARHAGRDKLGRKLREQQIEVTDPETGQTIRCRRITIPLRKPDAKGEKNLYVLTNLPTKVVARIIAQLYAERWMIENAFQQLAAHLQSEINTLAYPKAALFGFCTGCVAYNAVALVKGALRAGHGAKFVDQSLSMYYLTLEVAQVTAGMEIAIPEKAWTIFRRMTQADFLATLLALAKAIDTKKYTKHKRGPKKPQPRKISGKRHRHVSTARILNGI